MSVVKRRLRHLMHRLHDWVRQPGMDWLQVHLDKEALWSIQRRPIAGAVAVGLFAGLMPGPTRGRTGVAACAGRARSTGGGCAGR